MPKTTEGLQRQHGRINENLFQRKRKEKKRNKEKNKVTKEAWGFSLVGQLLTA